MPKNKRKLIGYVRPKKKPISEEEKALEEASITHDLDPIPEEVAPMPPEASLSAMSIADGGSNDAPPQEPLQESSKSRLSQMKAAEKAARHKLVVVRRRWCKTGRTHFNQEHGGARWATESELERALDRLQKVDNELDEAKRLYVDAHRARVTLLRDDQPQKEGSGTEPDLEERVQLLRLVNKMVDKCQPPQLRPDTSCIAM